MHQKKISFTATPQQHNCIILEPWGMIYDLKPQQQIEIVFAAEKEIDFEIQTQDITTIVYFNSSCTYKSYIDAELYDESIIPFPEMSMPCEDMINMLFGGAGWPNVQLAGVKKKRQRKKLIVCIVLVIIVIITLVLVD